MHLEPAIKEIETLANELPHYTTTDLHTLQEYITQQGNAIAQAPASIVKVIATKIKVLEMLTDVRNSTTLLEAQKHTTTLLEYLNKLTTPTKPLPPNRRRLEVKTVDLLDVEAPRISRDLATELNATDCRVHADNYTNEALSLYYTFDIANNRVQPVIITRRVHNNKLSKYVLFEYYCTAPKPQGNPKHVHNKTMKLFHPSRYSHTVNKEVK